MAYFQSQIQAPTVPQNFIPTNRVHSEFFLHGGPRLPLNLGEATGTNPALVTLYYDENTVYTVKRTPSFAGELYWSSAIPDGNGGYTVNRSKGSLYIAVLEPHPEPTTTTSQLRWKPVVPSHFDTYIDPATGKTWDPVGAYTCNPAFLCSG